MPPHSSSTLPAAAMAAAMLLAAASSAATSAQWCIARSGVSSPALQTALDYACGVAAADCLPILPTGLCYLPNSLPAHASYAFNSFYQRSGAAPGACDFAGAATISITDPSYGSCTYPSSRSTAGGSTSPTTNTPSTNSPARPGLGDSSPGFGDTSSGGGGIGGGLTPSLGTPLADADNSGEAEASTLISLLPYACCCLLLLLI